MAKVFLAAALLSGILAMSGCAGPLSGMGGYGYGGDGDYSAYGGGQSYPYSGEGGGYAQPVQPYYVPQPYAYSVDPGVSVYQPAPPVPQVIREHASAPPGRWIDPRQQRQEDRIRQGLASGQLTPGEARRLQNEPARIRGTEGRMRADGNLRPQERARLNAMQPRSSQDMYQQRHNGVQPGPAAQPRSMGPARPTAQLRPGGQPRAALPPQAAVQPQATAQPRAAAQPRTAAQPRSNGGRPARNGEGAP
jgi:hypothetical protein